MSHIHSPAGNRVSNIMIDCFKCLQSTQIEMVTTKYGQAIRYKFHI